MRLATLGLVTLAASLAWPALHAGLGFKAFNILYAIEFALYLLALHHVWRSPRGDASAKRDLVVVLLFAVTLRAALLWHEPFLSDDVYRYVWDGKVQAAGVNPYRYIPDDPHLASLHDAAISPKINRATYAPTIYPPAAQVTFLFAYLVGGGTVLGEKTVMVAFDLATVILLVRLLGQLGEDPRRVIVYAWNPLVCWEFAQSGHVDAVAITLIVGALVASNQSLRAATGVLLGCATLVKAYPLLLAPALLRRGGWRFVAGFASAFLLYIPYAGVGTRVLGFLPTYIHEEGIDTGSRFVLLDVVRLFVDVPAWAYVGMVAVVFAAVSVRMLRTASTDPSTEARHAATLAALSLAFGTPHYAWYTAWLVALVCAAPRAAWFYLSSAAALRYYAPRTPARRLAFEAAQFVPLVALLLLSARAGRRRSPPTTLTTTASPSSSP